MGKRKVNLTHRQQLFVAHYVNGFDTRKAAAKAKIAYSYARKLLMKPHVKKAIETAKKKVCTLANVDAAWLLRRLTDEAEADLGDLYERDGKLKPIHDWPKIWRQGLVQGIDIELLATGKDETPGTVVKIKLSDRTKRLELIGRHVDVQAFKDQLEVGGKVDVAQAIFEARRRLRGDDDSSDS